MQINEHATLRHNILHLLSADHWEDALVYWLKDYSSEELIGGLLGVIQESASTQNKAVDHYLSELRDWLTRHDNACRWRILEQAEELGFSTPLGAIGLSIFWEGGSLTPENCAPVYAEKHLAPLMLHTAFTLLSMAFAQEDPPARGAETLFIRWCHVRGIA